LEGCPKYQRRCARAFNAAICEPHRRPDSQRTSLSADELMRSRATQVQQTCVSIWTSMKCAATPCRARNDALGSDNTVVVHPRWFTGVRYDIELRVHTICFDENEHEAARSADPVDALADN
jgi:hypothetical protein